MNNFEAGERVDGRGDDSGEGFDDLRAVAEKFIKKNPAMRETMSSGTANRPSFTGITARGCCDRRTDRKTGERRADAPPFPPRLRPQPPEHLEHRGRQDRGDRVGDALARNVWS